MSKRLTERGPGFFLRILSPEERHDLVAGVLARLERKEGKQRQALVAESGSGSGAPSRVGRRGRTA